MAGSLDLKDFKVETFVREFGRELAVGQRKAGRKIGPKVVNDFRGGMRNVETRRHAAVYFKVHRNGTFSAVDVGVNARVRELGGTLVPVKPGVKALRVNFGKAERKTKGKFIVKKGDKVFLIGRPDGASKDKVIAILKRKVVMKPVSEEKRLRTIVKNALPAYMDEMMKHLNLGGLNAGR